MNEVKIPYLSEEDLRRIIREELSLYFKPKFVDVQTPNLLKKNEVQEILGVSASTLDRMIRSQEISYLKIGKNYRFQHEDIKSYMIKKG
jgi:excisionase family DNA binding protein